MRRLLLALLLLAPLEALAATYYAAPAARGSANGLTYADAVPVTSLSPTAGDTVIICGKTHRYTVTMVTGVTYDLNCSAYNDPATMSGADIVTSWTGPDANGNWASAASYGTPTVVLVDGVMLKHGPTLAGAAKPQWYYSANVVYLNFNPANKAIEVGARAKVFDGTDTDSVTIKGGIIESAKYAGASALITCTSCNNLVVRDTTLKNARGGVDCRNDCDGVLMQGIRTEYVADALDANGSGGTRPSRVRYINNTLVGPYYYELGVHTNYFENVEATHVAFDKEAIACTNCGSDYVASGNVISGFNIGIFYYITTTETDHVIEGNRVSDTFGHGVIITNPSPGLSTRGKIVGNLIVRAGTNIADPSRHAIYVEGSTNATGQEVEVAGNTTIEPSNNLYVAGSAAKYAKVNVHDNVFGSCARGNFNYYHVNMTNAQNAAALITIDENIYQLASGFNCGWRWSGGTYRTSPQFALFQLDSSKDAGSETASDLLLDSSTYAPKATSPAYQTSTAQPTWRDANGKFCTGAANKGAVCGDGVPSGMIYGP